MPKSLQGRLRLLFLSLLLLVLVSVGAMYWGLETQRQDTLVINLAGRQRMLAEKMARLAYSAGQGEEASNAALRAAEQEFDQTQGALNSGGMAPYLPGMSVILPATRDFHILSALNQINITWSETRSLLDTLQRTSRAVPSFAATLQSVQSRTTTLAEQADAVVRMYEADSAAKFNRLRALQLGFLAASLILLVIGALMVRRSVLKPLQELSRAVGRLGENDLDTLVRLGGPEEIRVLSRSFDMMRRNLRAYRQELLQLNDSLEERVAQRTRELEMLNEVSREISSRLDIQQVLNSVTDKARALLGGEVASLCLVDGDRDWLRLQALSGPPGAVRGESVPASDGLPGQVLERDQALLCGGEGACQHACRILRENFRVSHLASALRADGRVLGALCVGSRVPDYFSGEAPELLTKLANTAAIALENARLYAQAERVATMEERHRVAAEMHDGLGQTLSYLGLMTDQTVEFLAHGQDEAALERLRKTREAIKKGTAEVRRAINSLMDELPAELDVCARLHQAVDEFAAETHFDVTWKVQLESAPNCPSPVVEQVLNVTREALKNAARHAQARHISVQLGQCADDYYVTIEDNGRGFDASRPEPSGHFGLQIMQARAAHIGGRAEIVSVPGCGTRVTLTWPASARG